MATVTMPLMPRAIPEGYLSANKAAKSVGVGRETIFRWLREKKLQRYRMPGIRETLVKLDELERYVAGPRPK